MGYVFTLLAAYLIGCSNMAFYLAKWKNVDLKSGGSGNLGASNAVILMGWTSGALVAVHDVGKAVLAVLLARLLFPALPNIGAVAGVACVLGHIFPFYMRFRGGKGFASYLGMTLALNWKLALFAMIVVVIVTLVTDYLVLGTATTITVVPLFLGYANHSLILALILCVATAVIFYKHRENFVRIRKGTEIGLRSAAKGKHRVK